jgi:hypothetical protein
MLPILALLLLGQQDGGVATEDLGEPGATPPAPVEQPAPKDRAPSPDAAPRGGALEPMEPPAAAGEAQSPDARPADMAGAAQRDDTANPDDGPVAAFWFVDTEN